MEQCSDMDTEENGRRMGLGQKMNLWECDQSAADYEYEKYIFILFPQYKHYIKLFIMAPKGQ